jgi:hypothetical protein
LADHFDFDLGALSDELAVVKRMLQTKSLATIIDSYQELYSFTETFSTLVALIESAITILVSWTTCERTFSKMRLIKTAMRNTMTDDLFSFIYLHKYKNLSHNRVYLRDMQNTMHHWFN